MANFPGKDLGVVDSLGDPARMLESHFIRRDRPDGVIHQERSETPLPVAEYETGRFPSLRVFAGETREALANAFAALLLSPPDRAPSNLEHFPHLAAECFLKLFEGDKIVLDLLASEIGDILCLLNRDTFAHLRGFGASLLQIESTVKGATRLDDEIAELFPYRPTSLHNFLGGEILHAYNSLRELSTYIYPEPLASRILAGESPLHKVVQSLAPEDLAHTLAKAVALIPDETYTAILTKISPEVSGLAPFFRVFTPTEVQNIGRYEIRGWFTSKNFDEDALVSASFQEWTARRELPVMDRPFIPLIAIQHLKALRTWGPKVLETLMEVGKTIPESGYFEDSAAFHGFGGLDLMDGKLAKIPPPIAVLMAFYRHEAWIEERERSFRYDSQEIRRPHRAEHLHFDPTVAPGREYLPDLTKAYGFVRSLALWGEQKTPFALHLLTKLYQLATPDAITPFSSEMIRRRTEIGRPFEGSPETGSWNFEASAVRGEDVVSSSAAHLPKPMTAWSTLLQASGLTAKLIPPHSIPFVEAKLRRIKSDLLLQDRKLLGSVFQSLNALDCMPYEGESLEVVDGMRRVAACRQKVVNEVAIALLTTAQSGQNWWNETGRLDLNALVEWVNVVGSGRLMETFEDYLMAHGNLLARFGGKAIPSDIPNVILDSSPLNRHAVQDLISRRIVERGEPQLFSSGGITDSVYSHIFLREYLRGGNHLLVQRFGADLSGTLDGAFLFGGVGIIPKELAPLVRPLELASELSLAEMVVTAQDRRPGTYKRLFRSMLAYVALEGGSASLGLVHEANQRHIDLLLASGHQLLRGVQMPIADLKTGGVNTYIPALLTIKR